MKAASGAAERGWREQNGPAPELGQWLEDWLGICELRGLRAASASSYRTMISLYVPVEFARRRLDDITPLELNRLYAHLLLRGRRDGEGGLSPRTVRYLHAILRKAWADAIRLGLADRNPVPAADPPSARAARSGAPSVWSPAELRRFLLGARADRLYAAFHLAATTGLRRGELLGLRWRDLDLEAAQLRVAQTLVEVGHEVRVGLPKSDSGRRTVALDPGTVGVLREYQAQRELEVGLHRPPNGGDFVFVTVTGEPIHPALFSYYFQRRVRSVGVRRIRLHDLRHTHATHALQAGVNPKVVCERLGHSSVTITLDTYSHVLPSMQRQAAEAVAALVGL